MIIALKKLPSPPILLLSLISLTCLGVYWIGLSGPLILDDEANLDFLLVPNLDFNKIIHTQIFSPSGPLGRPVAMASFFVNAYLSQNLFYWKLTNFIIHLITDGLVFGFIRKLANWSQNQTSSSYIALAVAAIWLVHPLQVSTVLYTVQRMTQLATLFSIAGLYCYLLAREHLIFSKTFLIYQTLTWLIFFPLAVFSKETALLFPLFVLLLELFVLQKNHINNQTLAFIFTGLVITGLVAFWLKSDHFLGGYATREFTPSERLLTQGRVMVAYLAMLLMPTQNRLGFLHDGIELSTGLLQPWTTAPAIALLVFLLVSSFYFRKKNYLYSFGMLFFFAGHLLESTIFPLEIMYEHRNYLPSVGFFLALTALTTQLISNRSILIFLSAIFILLLSFTTWLRVDIWSSNYRLLQYFETNQAGSERVAIALSNIAVELKEYDLAREKIKPVNTLGAKIQFLYIDCFEHKQLSEEQLDIDITPFRITDIYAGMVLMDLANLGMNDKCHFPNTAYLNLLNNVLSHTTMRNLSRQKLLMYKAHYQWRLKLKEPAIDTLRQAFLLDQINPVPLFLACEWALDENLKATADELCPKAFSIAEKTPYKFDELAEKVRKRLQPSHLVN